MATIKLYHDTRAAEKRAARHPETKPEDLLFPLCYSIHVNGAKILLPTGLQLKQKEWRKGQVTGRADKEWLNHRLAQRISDIGLILARLGLDAQIVKMTPAQIKAAILRGLSPEDGQGEPLFREVAERTIQQKEGRTAEIYNATLTKVGKFADLSRLLISQLDYDWLCDFEAWQHNTLGNGYNTIAIDMRNLRHILNRAVRQKIISETPFDSFKIKYTATAKRSLTPDEFVMLKNYPVQPYQVRYRDMWLLVFYMLGINIVDLAHARKSDVINGRLEYVRRKTHKRYSVLIQPEAKALIDQYAGKGDYLVNIMDDRTDHKSFIAAMNDALQEIGVEYGKRRKKELHPIFPEITSYWARHTLATMFHRAGEQKDTISMALGHTFGSRITEIYIDYDSEKVDAATRRVFDWLAEYEREHPYIY